MAGRLFLLHEGWFTTAMMPRLLLLICVFLIGAVRPASAQNGSIAPFPLHQFFDNNGDPCSGCKLTTQSAGTTTNLATYQDVTLVTAHANPIIMDSAGRPPAGIYLSANSYKFTMASSADVTIWTIDNVSAVHAGVTGVSNTGDVTFQVDTDDNGSNKFTFLDGDGTEKAQINESGDLQIDDDLTIGDATEADHDIIFDGNTQDFYACLDDSADSLVVGSGSTCGTTATLTIDTTGDITFNQDVTVGSDQIRADIGACNGRMTLQTGTPVTTSDVLGATALYFTPYQGNRCSTYTGSGWVTRTFSEISLALGSDAGDTNYDLFLYDNSGTFAVERLAWTNATTRATALTLVNGIHVKSGETTRRYLGTYRTVTTTGQTEDREAFRYVWNYYNRVPRTLRYSESTDSWPYTTAAFRQANGSANSNARVQVVVGVAETPISLRVMAAAANTNANVEVVVGIGEDSTTTVATGTVMGFTVTQVAALPMNLFTSLDKYPDIGYHAYNWLEYSAATGATTWYGDNATPSRRQTGITGWIQG